MKSQLSARAEEALDQAQQKRANWQEKATKRALEELRSAVYELFVVIDTEYWQDHDTAPTMEADERGS